MTLSPKDDGVEQNALRRTKWGQGRYDSYQDVQRFFDTWAVGPDTDVSGSIDHDTDVTPFYRGPEKIAELIIPHLSPASRIIDICCGSGLSGERFIRAGHNVLGYDISKKMTQKALDRGYLETKHGNLLTDELVWPGSFGALISVGAFGEWVPPEDVLPKLLPLLHSDEAVIGFTSEIEHTDLEEVLKILIAYDFQILCKDIGPGVRHPSYPDEDYYYVVGQKCKA